MHSTVLLDFLPGDEARTGGLRPLLAGSTAEEHGRLERICDLRLGALAQAGFVGLRALSMLVFDAVLPRLFAQQPTSQQAPALVKVCACAYVCGGRGASGIRGRSSLICGMNSERFTACCPL
jgi:hypothetical protein